MKYTFTLLLLFILNPIFAQSWQLIRDEDNIKIYKQAIEGSKIAKAKTVTTFNASRQTLLTDIFKDVNGYTRWFDECISSELLERVSDSEVYARFVIKVPFPFQNRDVVANIKFKNYNNGTSKVIVKAVPGYIPNQRGTFRTPLFDSSWTLQTISEEKTQVTSVIHANMGGYIPAWAINSATMWGPFLSLKKIRTLIEP